jgi:hypothetical protein
VLLTSEVDLAESGDSFRTNNGIDIMACSCPRTVLYALGNRRHAVEIHAI